MTSYEELPGLETYVFEESFVLDVTAKPAVVSFRLEVVLTPEHPAYVAPGVTQCDHSERHVRQGWRLGSDQLTSVLQHGGLGGG
jgi:hypothetical protein